MNLTRLPKGTRQDSGFSQDAGRQVASSDRRVRLTGPGIFLIFLAAALLLNFSELANPPFYDEIIGLHNQAIYLAKHHFDTSGLYIPAQRHISGSWVYVVAIMPWIYGALYSVLPPLAVHIAGHLINIFSLCGALTLLVLLIRRRTDETRLPKVPPMNFCPDRKKDRTGSLRRLPAEVTAENAPVRDFCETKKGAAGLLAVASDDATALLWGFAAFCDPIIAGRFAAQGQEAPLVFCIMLSLFFAFRKKPCLAIAAAALGCTVKFTGVILLLAYAVFFLGQTVFLPVRRRKSAVLSALSILSAALFFYFFYRFNYSNPVRVRPILGEILRQITLFYPYYAVFLAGLAAAYLLRLKKIRSKTLTNPVPDASDKNNKAGFRMDRGKDGIRNFEPATQSGNGRNSANSGLSRDAGRQFETFGSRVTLLLWIFIGGYFCAYFLARAEQLPRYTAIVVMPMVLLAARIIRFRSEKLMLLSLTLLIALNCCNQYGLLLVPHRPSEGFASDLERSREYLAGLHSDMELLHHKERELAGRRIVCRWPYAQMLTMPELGYVKKALPEVYVADIVPRYAGAKPLVRWNQLNSETLYLYSPRNLPLDRRYREFCLPRTTSVFEYVEYPQSMADGLILFSHRFVPSNGR